MMFEGGKQYKFEYMGEVSSSTITTGSHPSQMSIATEVIISANTPCDLKLQVPIPTYTYIEKKSRGRNHSVVTGVFISYRIYFTLKNRCRNFNILPKNSISIYCSLISTCPYQDFVHVTPRLCHIVLLDK